MQFNHDKQPTRKPIRIVGMTRFSRLAMAVAIALAPAAFSKPAFAQQAENGFSGDASREARDAVSNFAYINSLGSRPVLGRGETMTREKAHQTALRLQENGFAPGDTSAAIEEILAYLGELRPGGQLQHELASAPRVLGEPGRVNITDRVEALQGGEQLPVGFTVEVRYNGVNSQRLMGGITFGDGSGGVGFDARNRLPGPNVGTSRILTTEGLEIRITERTAQGDVVREYMYFDEDCGNVAPYGDEQQPIAQSVEAAPCLRIRVKPPRNVNFTDESVRARVVMLDLGRAGTLPVEQCLSGEQVQVNCENECSNMMLDAAQRSQPYREALRRTISERGNNATISRIYSPDADYTPDAGGDYITLPVRADQVNENVVFVVCFDWENGGSSVVTITEPIAGQNGVLEDQLVMSGEGQNMTVFRGERRVSRPAR